MDKKGNIQGDVLVVEDDKGLGDLIVKRLDKAGYPAVAVATGAAALERIAAAPPAALLLDQKLPDMTGQDILAALAGRGLNIPFIVMTGQGDERLAVEMMKLGASDYLVKDMDFLEILLVAMQRLFKAIQTAQALQESESNLRESEARFRLLAENSTDMISRHDAQGKCLYVSPACRNLLGFKPEELIGRSAFEFIHPDDIQPVDRSRLSIIAQPVVSTTTFRALRKDGGTIWLETTSRAILDQASGAVLEIHAATRDITQRKQAEEALKESEEKYRQLVDTTSTGYVIVDGQGYVMDANQEYVRLTGRSRLEDVVGHRVLEWTAPHDLKRNEEEVRKCVEQGAVHSFEVDYITPSGQIIPIEINATTLRASASLRILTLCRDITERKRAEEALRDSEERYRAIFNNTALGIGVRSLNNEYIDFNERYHNMLGYSEEELKGLKTEDITHPDDIPISRNNLDEVKSGRAKFRHYEKRYIAKDGTPIWCEVSIQALKDKEGNICAVTGIVNDISERKRAEDEILEKSRELEALFTVSSHLRTAQTAGDMLPVVLAQMAQVLKSDANAIALYDPRQNHFTYAAGDGALAPNAGVQFDTENSVSGYVLQTRHPYVTVDLANDAFGSHAIRGFEKVGPMVVVPLQSELEFIGTLVCARAKDSAAGPFKPSEVKLLVSLGEMVGNALRRARLYEEALSRLLRVQGLHSIDTFINANMDIRITLKLIADQAVPLMNVDAAAILLYNQNLHMLEHAAAQGFRRKDIEKKRFELSGTFSERAIMERRIVATLDSSAAQDHAHDELMQKEGFAACYITPMIAKGKVLGVLELYNREPLHPDQEWIDFLEALGGQAAIAIDNARLFHDLQTSNFELTIAYDATIQGWSQALELREHETAGHSLRVVEMTLQLARAIGVPEGDLSHIQRGALLHDIGKMGIPDSILLKPGRLNPDEWEIMHQHPLFAYRMLSVIPYLVPALDIPRYHHEKWDGTGYPYGLQGTAIPLAARIFAIVDVWDALSTNRPYRPALSEEEVLRYIQEQSGKYFDPQITEVFLQNILPGKE